MRERQFMVTPTGRLVAVDRIAEVALTDTGLLILGDGDRPIDFHKCVREQAKPMHDELVRALRDREPGKPFPRMSWEAVAEAPSAQGTGKVEKSETGEVPLRVLPGATG